MAITSFLLHAANRNIKSESKILMDAFYEIKDRILKKHGQILGYDIQHIRGTKCNSCGGTGQHAKYGYNGKIYDYADCYHCWWGWYRLPKWNCLHRIKFGSHTFHKPLKREECVGNPFTKEKMGWEVTNNPVIEGYIEHKKHWFGGVALFIILWFYGHRDLANVFFREELRWKKIRIRNRINNLLQWQTFIFWKPKIRVYNPEYYLEFNDDLPF